MLRSRVLVVVRQVRRAVLVRRRPLAALLAALAVLAGIQAVRAPADPTAPVVVAATDLPGGAALRATDLRVEQLIADRLPDGTTTSPDGLAGRVLAAPVRAGEPLTDVRLVSPGLLDGYPGMVAVPVRVADAASVSLLDVGDQVDLVATPGDGGPAEVVVYRAPVVALPRAPRRDAGAAAGAPVVVAVGSADALALAHASVTAVLSVLIRR